MNPQNHEQISEFSPAAPPERQAIAKVPENFKAPGRETAANIASEKGAPSSPPPASAMQTAAVAQAPQTPPVGAATTTTATTNMPLIADDIDLIEKEWVDKAKQIVAQTSHDPFLQNKEINKVKADYLKKRYNKDLKLVDE